MTKHTKRWITGAVLVTSALIFAFNALNASARSEADSLARGAIADVTPQQKYNTAIREAGGAYKEALAECATLQIADRQACRREAKVIYDEEMASAKLILK